MAKPLYADAAVPALETAMNALWGDPVFARALGNSSAFVLSDVAAFHGAFVRMLDTMAAGGEAFIVPIAETEVTGAVVFAGRNLDLTGMARAILLVAAFAALTQAFELRKLAASGKRANNLSDREAECMRWVSIGKTDGDTGVILGISPRTVRFHVTNAKTKLGVGTRVQAVAKILAESFAA